MTENKFCMMSRWMENRTINEFVKAHPHENRFKLVSSSFSLLAPIVDIDK